MSKALTVSSGGITGLLRSFLTGTRGTLHELLRRCDSVIEASLLKDLEPDEEESICCCHQKENCTVPKFTTKIISHKDYLHNLLNNLSSLLQNPVYIANIHKDVELFNRLIDFVVKSENNCENVAVHRQFNTRTLRLLKVALPHCEANSDIV